MDAAPPDASDGMMVDAPDDPVDDEPLPDCRADAKAQSRSARWAAVRAARKTGDLPSIFLVQVGESGPGELHEMGLAVTDPGAIGMWSPDGAFFAFQTRGDGASSDGYTVVDVRGASAPAAREVKDKVTRFVSWAPQGTRYLVLRGGNAVIIDAADPGSSLDVELPPNVHWKVAWSADARYLAMTADSNSHVYVIDTQSAAPRVAAYGADTKLAQAVEWSTTGHRLVYSWWDGVLSSPHQLMLVDLDAPSPSAVSIAVLGSVSSGSPASWLDGDRVLARTAGGQLAVLDVSQPAISPEPVATLTEPASFRVTRGGRCAIFAGACGPNAERGGCVVSLDVGASRQLRRILVNDKFTTLLPHSGSPAVLIDGASIVEVPLDGSGDAPVIVNADAPLAAFNYTVTVGESGDFIFYRATPNGATAQRALFWSTRSGQTFTIEHEGPFSFAGSSPDSRLFALASDRLSLVSLDDVAEPRVWSLELVVGNNGLSAEVAWQP